LPAIQVDILSKKFVREVPTPVSAIVMPPTIKAASTTYSVAAIAESSFKNLLMLSMVVPSILFRV